MHEWQLNTAVAFIVFNRPDSTQRVFSEIAKARPRKLLIVADGPRREKEGELARCLATRAVVDQVDWDCEVLTNFSESNLGCKLRVASGLDWVFDHVEEAIILEDDCIPHPGFFRFCDELIDLYRHDERIGMISGDNFQFGRRQSNHSYYFSRYNHIWGWASWRRAWKYYDRNLDVWPDVRQSGKLGSIIHDRKELNFWRRNFDRVHSGKVDTWDYQWTLALWLQSMLTIIPSVNLVSNIGFGPDATHTNSVSVSSNLAVEDISFPLKHPPEVLADRVADRYTFKKIIRPNIFSDIVRRLRL